MAEEDFKTEYLELYNVKDLPISKEFLEKNKIDIEQWNGHDWKNLIAFKDKETLLDFIHALDGLIMFYNTMEHKKEKFEIFYKSYCYNNLTELQNDSCNFIRENYWDDILEAAEKGYILIYFTTQRECHDKNQFLMYMVESWMYSRHMTGHRWGEEDVIKDIEFIVLNEK